MEFIKDCDISKLKPYQRNPRKNDGAVDAVVRSIESFGFLNPIIVDGDFRICAGHTRHKAAIDMGLERVPVIVAPELVGDKFTGYNIADNQTASIAEWDDSELKAILAELEAEDFDLSSLGFDDDDLSAYLGRDNTAGLTDPDAVPDAPEEPITQMGDLWLLGDHRLLCGDATKAEDVARLMDGEKADMCLTDPPYGINVVKNESIGGGGPFGGKKNARKNKHIKANTYHKVRNDDTTEVARQHYGICTSMGIVNMIIFGGNYFADFLPCSRGWLCWDKIDGVEGTTKNFSDIELAWTTYNVPARIIRHRWQGLLKASESTECRVHPTQKPIQMLQECIELYEGGQIILDAFVGSGSTIIAAEQLGRKCYAMEIDPIYCDVAVKRWEEFTGRKAERREAKAA